MKKRVPPAVDRAIAPRGGVTREGQPLSYNRAAAPDLAPWVGRLYATVVDLPPDHRIDCALFHDTTTVRLQLYGSWTAETADGPRQHGRSALIFGPQSRAMPVSVTGSFASIGFVLRPGSGYALHGRLTGDFVDRLTYCDDLGLPGNEILAMLDTTTDPETWLTMLEETIRKVIAQSYGNEPDPVITRFEELAYSDPSASVWDFAQQCGISQKQLERIVRRDFGLTPKQVLRRARALDMASYLRGVADQEEAEELALRFYDQSHLIREFTQLFGMSPRQFVERPQPIMTLALESRQARRLEVIRRIAPGAPRPWQ